MYFSIRVNSNMDFFKCKSNHRENINRMCNLQTSRRKKKIKKINQSKAGKEKKVKQEHNKNTKFRGEKNINNKLSRINLLIKYQIEF